MTFHVSKDEDFGQAKEIKEILILKVKGTVKLVCCLLSCVTVGSVLCYLPKIQKKDWKEASS